MSLPPVVAGLFVLLLLSRRDRLAIWVFCFFSRLCSGADPADFPIITSLTLSTIEAGGR
jgi:ABC-type tungstate transport system substrate-binding protein